MGRRFRVILDVQSNMSGTPPLEDERKLVMGYLESVKGVGEISVIACDEALKPGQAETIPSESWLPEAPTTNSGKKKKKKT